MHAYLLIGNKQQDVDIKVDKLLRKLKVKQFEYPLIKIKDVRELNSFTKLSINSPTGILIRNIDSASTEALNAFLKNLEEPQKNIFYILTASSINNLPPTIISRCQIVKVKGKKELDNKSEKEIRAFVKKNKVEQLQKTSRIWNRQEAISFVENYILYTHSLLLKADNDHRSLGKNARCANQTLGNLGANGNVQLQLTNFVLGLV
jgi:DNA polymerase-3 subunit delta'